jgi:hypothetical protein
MGYRSWNLGSGVKDREMNEACIPPTPQPKAYHVSYRYYHTLFTHSLPKALRTIADETPTCVDVLMNFLVATVTKLPPIKVPYGRQHPEAVPMVRRLQGLESPDGEGKEGGASSLSNPNLVAAA